MSIYTELSSINEIDNIKGIRFCILSPEEIKRISVAEVYKTDTYVSTEPVVNGLFDPRMGVLDHNKVCQTCEQKNTFCPGHFGHINLSKPVFYIQFFDVVKKLLKCVCFRCSKLLINPNSDQVKSILNRKYSRQKRWELLYKLCSKIKRCGADTMDGCGAKQADKIYREPIVKIIMEWKELAEESRKQVMNAEEILRILKRISDKDAEILGFSKKYNRPEWMICTVLPVPPPAVRPSVRTDTGQRSEDDLTHKLCDIVKSNNSLKSKIEKGASKEQVDIATQVLQYHVATFIDNKIPGINPAQQRTGRLLKSLTERLKSKDGRIRGNLMGKRVDFSARSVITPDPNISIDELGVPLKIAMNLTFPEIVNKHNREKLTQYVINGPDVYPGAKFIRKGNWTKALKNMPDRINIILDDGDVVDRHLIDGDYVLFNRQPSLHKYSMLCHRVKVMPYNTFRLNVCVCPLYNSDFDGDEMNMHVPQSITSANELIELAAVPNLIISVRECKPIVAIVQDVALGVYRFTKSGVQLSQKQMFNLMANNIKFTGIIPEPSYRKDDVVKWSGRQALSAIIPKNINIRSPNKSFEETETNKDLENFVIIENGELIQGIVDKTIYQNRTKGLIHSIYNECSQHETRIFFDNTQKIICDWLVTSGFSVGISDLIVDENTNIKLKKMIHDMKVNVYDVIRDIHMGTFENKSINSNSIFFEEEVNKILNQTISKVGKVALSNLNDLYNRMINMVKAGSKGSIINVSQMVACLGQQNVDGKRIPYGFEDRTLPHYTKYDDGPESRGFVENSFMTGLTPQQFFFHSMGGREGLIDTAVKSVTGDTAIVIIEDGIPKYVKIGDWIDGQLDTVQKDKIKYYPGDRNLELLNLETQVYIPTCNENGHVTWGELTAITRHDPGERLYEVKTQGGRCVIVAESKSLLIWNKSVKEFQAINSPDVKIGDSMPVTVNLATPPVMINIIDMAEYFPKSEYIHGLEFNKAIQSMEKAMDGRIQIPRGWWEANNGTTFTLPYTKKASLTRLISGRSNTDNIKDNYIYPYHATREHCLIPDKFELNQENGIFIGLFLSEGSSCDKSGTVTITNIDQKVQAFVKTWFDKLSIKNKVDTSSSVIGYSSLLARLLDKLVGHGAHHKYVPDVAFVAPEEFVTGILSGYFTGDSTIGKTNIDSTSASARVTEGISILCTRLGIFGKVFMTQLKSNNVGTIDIDPSHRISITAQWAHIFAKKVKLLIESKQEQLQCMMPSDIHRNFEEYNNVIFDRIKEINILGVDRYPKLYDVTVPSTLNFQIANGLNVRDTSETGYIQRKLVKAMEDCKINYDYTVRNASGSIIQFLYGEDGMDATKIESQPILYIDMDYVKLKNNYHLTKHDNFDFILEDDIIKELHNDDAFETRMNKHFEQVLKDREFMIKDVFNSIKETSIMYPVSFMRIINNAKALYNKYEKEVLSDLSPLYVLDTIDKLSTELFINKNNRGNKFIGILIRCYLSPKKVLFNYKFSKMAFDNIIQQIKLKFYDAIAHPSEMVGVIAAQSIGEPCTQMSQLKSTIIRITGKDNYSYSGPIGEFIDNLIDKNKENVINIGNDSIVMDLKDTYNIIGVSDNEKTSWKKISQISRHHANGGMVKVYTRSGKITTATLTHSFLKRTEKGIEAILGSDLKVGLRIPVAKYIAEVENPLTNYTIGKYGNVILDNDMGWLCGVYIADGNVSGNGIKITKCIPEYYNNLIKIVKNKFDKTISQRFTERSNFPGYDKSYKGVENNFNCKELSNFFGDNFGRGSENKKVPAWVYGCSKEFISGLIQGYFDGDGNVNCDKGKGMIRAGSISEELINDMIVLLAYFGIFGSKCLEWSKTGKVKKPFHTIQISRKYAKEFNDKIGFIVQEKAINLQELIQYVERSDIHSDQEQIDKIPELGNIISSIGKQLELPGQSRLYGRWEKKNSIGRKTLLKYIKIFEDENNINKISDVSDKITLLKQAAYSDVVWDEIVELEYLDDPKEYVYDFTVPGNDSFMVDACILVHNTLNTFHLSGVSSASRAVRGVPRIKELLSVTKNIKSPGLTIYIKNEFNKDKKKCNEILNTIETTYFKDIVSSTKIFYDPDDFNTTIEDDKLFLATYSEFINQEMISVNSLSPWLLRMEFDKEKLVEYDISMIDVYHVLQDFYDNNINAMFSDDNAKKLVFRIKIYEENDQEKDIITELKALEKNIMESLIIKGIKKINKVSMNKKESMQYVDETMTYDKTYEWILESSGSNLLDILCHKMVDVCRTISNNINEIYEIFGIEASRQALYNEIWEVIKDADLYVNYRHLALLVDTMTNKGYLLSIDRHGINRVDIGPLAKSSFEETTDMLIKAGIFSEVDKINGVSANIMLGQIPPCGTGDTDIIIDELKLMELISQYIEDENEDILEVDESVKDAACSLDNLTFDFAMPDIDETIVKKNMAIKIV
jgi:DNA-directed RNA polymerase beta' subunit